ncbi:hypothetical protein N7444_008214 [Penicillium canescens]|nr:hypothetical protein N7444_008214 [Penicillium canescens]
MFSLDAPSFVSRLKQSPILPCIAETMKRSPAIDLYHINDFHGRLAPFICCRLARYPFVFHCITRSSKAFGRCEHCKKRKKFVLCSIYHLKLQPNTNSGMCSITTLVCYLRYHQRGFGAVGVSQKYSKRSWAHPTF